VVAYQPMKMYVTGYKQRDEGQPLVDPSKPWEDVDVRFTPKRGDWLMNDRGWAERELELINSMRVRSKEHFCRFEIEEEEGQFAIVCTEHPHITRDGFKFDSGWIDTNVARFTNKQELWAVRVTAIEKEIAAHELSLKDMLRTSPDDRAGHAHLRAYIDALKQTQEQLGGHPER